MQTLTRLNGAVYLYMYTQPSLLSQTKQHYHCPSHETEYNTVLFRLRDHNNYYIRTGITIIIITILERALRRPNAGQLAMTRAG